MKVSIVTTSYNYEEFIKETIESVIAQTYTDWEMIIVDDGSKDKSVDVIKSYCAKDERIKLFQHEGGINRGIVNSVKLGIEKATSDWIVFLESDDTIVPDYLETKFEITKENPDIKFIFNDVNMFGDVERIRSYDKHFQRVNKILHKNTYPTKLLKYFKKMNVIATFSVVMLKKDLLKDIDFNVKFKPLLDWYLWSQLAVNNDFYYINKKLTNWRIHKNSYISVKPTLKERYQWDCQLKKVCTDNRNLFYKLSDEFYFFRRSFLRIYFKRMEVCFLGHWYSLNKE